MRYSIILLINLLSLPLIPVRADMGSVLWVGAETATATENSVVLSFSIPNNSHYKIFTLKQPQRLVLDFSGAHLGNSPIQSPAQLNFLRGVRAANHGPDKTRIVLDLKQEVDIERFSSRVQSKSGRQQLQLTIWLKTNRYHDQDATPLVFADTEQNIADVRYDDADVKPAILKEWDISGYVGVEDLAFLHDGLAPEQHNNYVSGVFQAEFYKKWDDGRQSFAFVPFYRYSQHDNRRTHFDIRELTWLMVERSWELRVGFRKVFWGVAEGLHLIDIINQTDLVENIDTEDKLGQPMINLALINDWGTVDLFVMPGFRERTFSGVEGRFRLIPEIAVNDAIYDRSGLEKHMSYALRWSHYIGDWDIGISHFYGMNREPRFIPSIEDNGRLKLVPFYETINQTSLDLQMTHESWLWKLEAMVRSGMDKTYFAAVGGLEYTLFDLYETGLDVGFVLEYMYDTRGSGNFYAPFQDDFLTALRFGFNDEQSTEILAGVMFDRTSNTKFYNIEASRRIGDSWKIEAEMRFYAGSPPYDSPYFLREDDHFRIELSYHF